MPPCQDTNEVLGSGSLGVVNMSTGRMSPVRFCGFMVFQAVAKRFCGMCPGLNMNMRNVNTIKFNHR